MKASEFFGLFVRIVGFLVLTYGAWSIWAGIEGIPESLLQKVGGVEQPEDSATLFAYFAFGIPEAVFGAFCLFCADWVTKFVYRNP